MFTYAIFTRTVLALVFGTAAVAKLLSRHGSAGSITGLGLDKRLLPVVRILPLAELTVAAALLPGAASRLAAVASCGLLTVFTAVLLRAKSRGVTGSCNCFGPLSRSGQGIRSGKGASFWSFWPVARNSVLSLAAVPIVLPGRHLHMPDLWAAAARFDAVLSASVALAVVMTSLWSRRYMSGLLQGRRILARRVKTLAGSATRLSTLINNRTATLVFVDPACGPCQAIWPHLRSALQARGAGPPLLAVTQGGTTENRHLFEGVAQHLVIADDGSLLAASGAQGTPAAVVISRGRAKAVFAGAETLLGLLAPGAPAAREQKSPLFSRRWARREALKVALAGTGLAIIAQPLGPLARLAAASTLKSSGVKCSSCGSCAICEVPGAQRSIGCRACAKKCSAQQLCSSYANQFTDFQRLASYLSSQGYTQAGEPVAGGLEDAGKLLYLALMTPFRHAGNGRQAVLTYGLANNGQSAAVAYLDTHHRISSVVTPGPNGALLGALVPSAPSLVPGQAGNSGTENTPGPRDANAEPAVAEPAVASCADTCKQMFDIAAMALYEATEAMEGLEPLLAEAELVTPAGWAFALGSFVASQILLPQLQEYAQQAAQQSLLGSVINKALGKAVDTATGAEMPDKLLDLLKDKAVSELCNNLVCKIKLKACCNYTGACFDSDALCESKCPGGLAHPMAHCDVYVNGVKVSTLVP